MKKYLFFFVYLIILNIQQLNAQNFQWANGFGGSVNDEGFAICTDSYGNNYTTGIFRSSPAFFDTLSVNCYGSSYIYVLKTDPVGNIAWLATAGGNYLNYGSGAYSIISDNNNNIFLTGSFAIGSVFDTINISSYGLDDGFLAKYNDTGHCLWVKKIGGTNREGARSVCLAGNQNVLICGSFPSTVAHFDTIDLLGSGDINKRRIFLAKYDTSGKCLWAKQSTSGNGEPMKIKSNNSQIYMAGFFMDSLNIDGNNLIAYSNHHEDVFIAAFNFSGDLNWLRQAGGIDYDLAKSICLDNNGNCYVTGLFFGTASFGTQTITAGSTNGDMFIAKYDSSGNFIWVKQLYSSGGAEGKDIVSDGNNGFYVTGYFSGSALFGTYSMNSLTQNDMFIAHYNNNGNFLGVRNVANATGYGISMDTGGNCIITGTFTSSTLFDGINLVSHGDDDIFLAKMDAITGMPDKVLQNDKLVIYANPTTGKCNITVPDDFVNEKSLVLCVYDNKGTLIQRQNLQMEGDKIRLSLEEEAKGIYTATLSNGKKMYSGKIVFE
jgi:hypothetical protein